MSKKTNASLSFDHVNQLIVALHERGYQVFQDDADYTGESPTMRVRIYRFVPIIALGVTLCHRRRLIHRAHISREHVVKEMITLLGELLKLDDFKQEWVR